MDKIRQGLNADHLTAGKGFGKADQNRPAARADIHDRPARAQALFDAGQLPGGGQYQRGTQRRDPPLVGEEVFVVVVKGLGRSGPKRLGIARIIAGQAGQYVRGQQVGRVVGQQFIHERRKAVGGVLRFVGRPQNADRAGGFAPHCGAPRVEVVGGRQLGCGRPAVPLAEGRKIAQPPANVDNMGRVQTQHPAAQGAGLAVFRQLSL